MALLFELILAWLLAAKSVRSACTVPSPVAVPITDVGLSNGNTMRGIAGSVGQPAQNISFLPHAFYNDTWIYNSSLPFCFDDTTDPQCFTMRGGLYDPAKSSSAQTGLNVNSAGGDKSDTIRGPGSYIWASDWTTDRLSLGNGTAHKFPIGMPGFDHGDIFDTQANVGLGQNSTLLNALKDSGQIASRSYSYWWGVNSATSTNAMDGHLVLGGYDAAKVTGPNITRSLLPPSASCPSGMLMTVTNMILGFPNGTRADMLAPSTLSACIQPDYPVIMSPRFDPFFQRFLDLTGTSHNDDVGSEPWAVPAWRLDGMYPGDLTIVSDSQMRFSLPNDVLILPEESVASDGSFDTNASAPGILMAPTVTVNVNDVPILGRPFFTAAYLMVDLDAQTWTIWQANATTDSALVPIGGTCSRENSPQDGSDTNFNGSGSEGAASTAEESESEGGLSTGAIAGIAVGAVAGCLLAALLCFLFVRRRRLARRLLEISRAAPHQPDKLGDRAHAFGQGDQFGRYHPQEISAASEVHEVDSKHFLAEAPGGWRRQAVELPSSK